MNRMFLLLPVLLCHCAGPRLPATPEQAGWQLVARQPDTYCPPASSIPWKAGPEEWQGEFIQDATGNTRYYVPPASPELRRQALAWQKASFQKADPAAATRHTICRFLRNSTLSTALMAGGFVGIGPVGTYSEAFHDIWTEEKAPLQRRQKKMPVSASPGH